MRHPARRKALLVGAACGVALLGAGVVFRRDLSVHYHAWRLDGALTLESAMPWLAKLKDDVQDPARAQRLVAMLGPQRPRLTFWVFQWPQTLGSESLPRDALFPSLGWLSHFARSLEDRLRRDEGFLAVMAHFYRWNKDKAPFGLLNELQKRSLLDSMLYADFKREIEGAIKSELLRSEPAFQEGVLRTLEAWLLAEAWLLGMSPLPPPGELSSPLSEQDVDRLFRRWEDLEGWVRVRRDRLRFDPASGRFVEVPPGQGSPEVPTPTEPLPGWTGPVPLWPPPPRASRP